MWGGHGVDVEDNNQMRGSTSPQICSPTSIRCAPRPSHFACVLVGFHFIIKCPYEDTINSKKKVKKVTGAF